MSDIVERLRRGLDEYFPEQLMTEAADEIERLRERIKQLMGPAERYWEARWRDERAATIEECEVAISDVFASTSPRDYMMNGSGGILKRMIDALHALVEEQK